MFDATYVFAPFFEKAKTYLGVEPQPVPPVYAPEVVSDVILHAAERPLRELIAGGSGAGVSFSWSFEGGLATMEPSTAETGTAGTSWPPSAAGTPTPPS